MRDRLSMYLIGDRPEQESEAARQTYDLFEELRQWRDFAMWFTIYHPRRRRSVRYDWFMKKSVNREYVRRFYPGDLAPLASAREHVIAFVYGCTAARPFLKVVGALFNGGQEEEVSKEEFLTWVNDEIAALEKCLSAQVLELTKQPASWHSRDDLFPHGMKLQELYNDYFQVREEMASCYARVISVTRMAPSSPVVFGAPVPPPGTEQVRSRRRRRQAKGGPPTDQQSRVLDALSECKWNFAEVGRCLGLNPKTVREHAQAAYRKMGVSFLQALKTHRAKPRTQRLPHERMGQVHLSKEDDHRLGGPGGSSGGS